MSKYLIIFIDSFPYEMLKGCSFSDKFLYKSKLTPGLGYSVNIHAEIFAGLSADKIGFFNTWKFSPKSSPFKAFKSLKSILSIFGNNRYLNRIFRELIKFACGTDSLNIPYKYIDLFAPCGHSIYSKDFPALKIIPEGINEKDIISLQDAKSYQSVKIKIKEEGRAFLSFVELDEFAHRFGLGSKEYNNLFKSLDNSISKLCNEFRKKYPEGHIAVLSDHGMSKVKKIVKFDLKDALPKKDIKNIIYFLDTTMARLWYRDAKIKASVEDFLASKDYGKLLTEEERVNFGIADKKWADSILLLNEEYVFAPSFLEKGRPLAMHGYHPDCLWQKGIFLYSGPNHFILKKDINTFECNSILKEIFKSG